jgi:hypothetical protein
VKFHLDSRIILSDDSKYKNLYEWFLFESNGTADKNDRSQVPWQWSLYFTLADIKLSSSVSVNTKGDELGIKESESIKARLVPNDALHEHLGDDTRYSMLGTNRQIRNFSLEIRQIAEGMAESCSTWGCVSYTAEVDFGDMTSDDVIYFNLRITPDRLAKYAKLIRDNAITGGVLRVDQVAGFYSEWSPAVSTSYVKVLTADREGQPVEAYQDLGIEPPRLGKVGEFELFLYRDIKFNLPAEAEPGAAT